MTATPLDRRLNAYRADLADARLQGRVTADRFVAGLPRAVVLPVAPLHARPDVHSGRDSELIYGETVRVFEMCNGWAWVQSDADGYVGYAPASALGSAAGLATHRVTALATFVYQRADIKAPVLARLPFGARLHVTAEVAGFAVLADGGFVFEGHVAPASRAETDFVEVAARFLGVPYLWGGRSSLGLDCSALVQTALSACGIACPRDSDMQEAGLGAVVAAPVAGHELRRGDLVFWRGHVAIAMGEGRILHANAHHMAVATEDADSAIARIAAGGSAITSVRRLAGARAT